jgi:hypothetical protein
LPAVHVSYTGLDVAIVLAGGDVVPKLDTYATIRCVVATVWLVVAAQVVPKPQAFKRTPVVASKIWIQKGEGPTSLLVVAVNEAVPPRGSVVALVVAKLRATPCHKTPTLPDVAWTPVGG